jgi:prepilin-type N-terminal cleavage/methylation domain-containing protein
MAKANHVGQGARGGFTLVELLVVITIIGILMGLLIPAVNAARETARRNQCATQIKNLALAAMQYENSKKQFPGFLQNYGTFAGGADPSDPANYGGTVPRHIKLGTWAVALLPWLDAQATYEHWTEDRYPIMADSATADLEVSTGESGDGFHGNAAPNLAIMQCPSNPVSVGDLGKNSYIANNGMHPVRADGTTSVVTFEASQSRNNGVFNTKYIGTSTTLAIGPKVRLDDFKDGQGNTLLFSENLQAIPWHRPGFVNAANLQLTTGTPPPTDVAYPSSARYVHGMVWHYEDDDSGITTMTWTNGTPEAVNKKHLINGGGNTTSEDKFTLTMTSANASDLARPSSAHVDGVNVGTADGGTRFIQDSIDYRTYQALLTLRGKSSDVPWAEFVLKGEEL